jgi:hypothetical protein
MGAVAQGSMGDLHGGKSNCNLFLDSICDELVVGWQGGAEGVMVATWLAVC